MNKLAILAILLAVLVACAPAMPARNNNVGKDTNISLSKNVTLEKNVTTSVKNQTLAAPTQKDLPTKEVIEGELVSFPNLKAADPDGDPITYTFSSPLNAKGEWSTKEGDAGEYEVTITASDGENKVTQDILVIVKPKNRPPTINLADAYEAREGETFTLNASANDPEGQKVNVSYSGWMTSSSKNVGYDESGVHKVRVTATDGKASSTKETIVSVKNVNRAPELADIKAINVKEGQPVSVKPSARDPDGDTVTFEFEEPLSANGSWTPQPGDAGEYELIVIASDGEAESETTVSIIVAALNRAPVIKLDSVTVNEGQVVVLSPDVTDNEDDAFNVTYSGWMTSARKQTSYEDSGSHKVTVTAKDTAGNVATKEITVTVKDVNRPPTFGDDAFS